MILITVNRCGRETTISTECVYAMEWLGMSPEMSTRWSLWLQQQLQVYSILFGLNTKAEVRFGINHDFRRNWDFFLNHRRPKSLTLLVFHVHLCSWSGSPKPKSWLSVRACQRVKPVRETRARPHLPLVRLHKWLPCGALINRPVYLLEHNKLATNTDMGSKNYKYWTRWKF